ncbi:MAG: TonB-dependent receptor [Caulobacter sp.]|nr:TonB-dependent receptor [Caulobacter sp.]
MTPAMTLRTLLCAATALTGVALTAPAFAQEAEASAVEEVIITARKKAESLQDTPVTVTAFSGEQLQEQGITDFQKLADATPGVTIDAFPRAAPRPFFRGIGSSNQSAGGDPSSVAFLDGVYLGRGAMLAVDTFDLERVEVLKGPQGTLWGKNVVGGAVNFVTARPTHEFFGRAAVTLAQFDQFNANLMLNVPVVEGVAFRGSIGRQYNEGFRKNTNTGEGLDDDNRWSGRAHLLIELGEDSSLLFTADAVSDDLAGGARYNLRPFGDRDIDKPRNANPDRPGFILRDTGGLKVEYNTDALGWASLTGIASWRTLDYDSSEDLDGTDPAGNAAAGLGPVTGLQVLAKETADSYSTEWRLASKGEGPLSWTAGLFYLKDEVRRERETETAAVDLSENRFIGENVTKSFAAFGELEYGFDFGLNLFAGLRYTDEEKEYEITRLTGPQAAPVVNFTTKGNPGVSSEQIVTWRVGADWRFNDNVFAFASVATGFKSGAFQEQPNVATARIPTDPEEVINYEAGLKTDWWNRRVRANASVFYAEYTNLQTIQSVPDASAGPGGASIVVDTGDATIAGLEAEFRLVPDDHWEAGLSYTYLDATFDRLTQTSAILIDGTPVLADLSGNRLSRTPEHAVSLDVSYTTSEFAWGWVKLAASANYESEVFDDNANDLVEYRKPRTLWDASATWHFNDKYSLQLWGRNLGDVEYRTHQVETGGGFFVQYGPPRQVGLTLTASF